MNAISPNVFVRNGAVFSNSRDVAAYFEKEHRNVLRDIDNLLKSLDCSKLSNAVFWFEEAMQPDGQGINRRSFDMTRDGFTLLAMGFTGAKALQFKLAYIEAFNCMENEIRSAEAIQAPTVDGLLEPELERMWQGRLALAHRILGRSAAQKLWALSPFPQVALSNGAARGANYADRNLDPQGCLRHLLDWTPRGQDDTIHDIITDAEADNSEGDAPARFLRKFGILMDPKGWEGWIAISNTAPDLARVYTGTKWRKEWQHALLQLPEARRSPGVMYFHTSTKAVLIHKLVLGE